MIGCGAGAEPAAVRYGGMRTLLHPNSDAMIRLALAVLLALPVASAAHAQDGARAAPPPAKTQLRIAVFGNDPCPKGEGDEIVVCARLPESERYRVPKPIREAKAAEHKEQSWVTRSRDIDQAGNETLPNGCSAVGPGGTTGCFQTFMRDARAQRAEDAAAASDVP